MQTTNRALPKVATRAKWLVARQALLTKEKELTHRRDALNTERRRLPMVKIEQDYVFADPNGKASLLDLFKGRRQLIIYHFMFDLLGIEQAVLFQKVHDGAARPKGRR